jgi:TPR repeat protein
MMRAEVSQPPTLAPGFALVTISDADSLDPATLQFSVENPPRGFMQEHIETPWGTTHAWLRPAAAASVADGVELTLGPDRTWFMRPNVTYVMRLRDAAKPSPLTLRIAWKGIRMPSQAPGRLPDPAPKPATDETVKLAEPPAEAIQMEPVVAEPPRVEAPRVVVRPGGNKKVLIGVAALLLLLAACVLAWFYLKRTPSPGTPVQAEAMPPPMPSTAVLVLGAASARAYLQAGQIAPDSYAEAQRYLKDGSPDALQGALVLLGRAADAGSGPAQTALGRMYDPDTFSPQTSAMKAPDPEKALLWYQRAAKSNDPEGLYRLGKLLLSGRASAPGLGPEQGAADLKRAADLGYKDAQAEIDRLRTKPN